MRSDSNQAISNYKGLRRFASQKGLNVCLDGPEGTPILWAFADPARPGASGSGGIRMILRLPLRVRQFEESFK